MPATNDAETPTHTSTSEHPAASGDDTIAAIVYNAPTYDDAIAQLTATGQLRDGNLYVTRAQYRAIMQRDSAQPLPLFGPSSARATGPSVQVIVCDDPTAEGWHGQWQFTDEELDLLDLKPGDTLGGFPVGPPIDRPGPR